MKAWVSYYSVSGRRIAANDYFRGSPRFSTVYFCPYYRPLLLHWRPYPPHSLHGYFHSRRGSSLLCYRHLYHPLHLRWFQDVLHRRHRWMVRLRLRRYQHHDCWWMCCWRGVWFGQGPRRARLEVIRLEGGEDMDAC